MDNIDYTPKGVPHKHGFVRGNMGAHGAEIIASKTDSGRVNIRIISKIEK